MVVSAQAYLRESLVSQAIGSGVHIIFVLRILFFSMSESAALCLRYTPRF